MTQCTISVSALYWYYPLPLNGNLGLIVGNRMCCGCVSLGDICVAWQRNTQNVMIWGLIKCSQLIWDTLKLECEVELSMYLMTKACNGPLCQDLSIRLLCVLITRFVRLSQIFWQAQKTSAQTTSHISYLPLVHPAIADNTSERFSKHRPDRPGKKRDRGPFSLPLQN